LNDIDTPYEYEVPSYKYGCGPRECGGYKSRKQQQQTQPSTKKPKQEASALLGVVETQNGYMVEVDLPGITKENISLDVNDAEKLLIIRAERKPTYSNTPTAPASSPNDKTGDSDKLKEDWQFAEAQNAQPGVENVKFLVEERVYGSIERQLQLPKDADSESVGAKFDNGVLIVSIAKRAQQLKKPIQIQ
jgi:HSP20 family molecular chaperone IbpA